MNVLIVDDHAINLKLLRVQLEAEGHAVLEAADGVEALNVLGANRVDAVISDVVMPNMDGFRLCHEIRKSDKLNMLPLVLYSASYNPGSDEQFAETVGADYFVVKPAPVQTILHALHKVVQKTRGTERRTIPEHDEIYVLKQYSKTLVEKLEERNTELREALEKLQTAHQEILALNRGLELSVQQRTTELQSANRELESFSYSVSHDLRSPLRAIDGFSRILEEDYGDKLDDEGRRLFKVIRDNSRKMEQLIDDLLELARLGRKPLSAAEINTKRLVEEVLGELQAGSELRPQFTLGALPPAYGDAVLIKQAWVNLLDNAIKFSGKREQPVIEVSGRVNGAESVYCVKDNGAGFDMNYSDKLFGVFQRLHSTEEFEGTGVGLAIVQRVVSRHGGRVWAEGKVGEGASFHFSLPKEKHDGQI